MWVRAGPVKPGANVPCHFGFCPYPALIGGGMRTKSSSENRLVTLYVVPGCPLCADARAWLARHEVDYLERDVSHDFSALRAMYRFTRQGLVPVFEVGGRALVRPSDDELTQLILV